MEINHLGQPVGDPVPGWTARPLPSAIRLDGRYCRLERLDAGRHAARLFAADAQDRSGESWTYLPYGPFAELAGYEAWVERSSSSEDPMFYAIVVTDGADLAGTANLAGAANLAGGANLADGRPLGVLSLLRIAPDAGTIEVGHVHYSPLLQRRRAATEAQLLVMRHAFDDLGYRRYEWKCDALNAPSRAAAERLGFTFEGVFRQAVVVKGRNRDTAWYSVTDAEWPAVRERIEAWLDPGNFDADGRQRAPLGRRSS